MKPKMSALWLVLMVAAIGFGIDAGRARGQVASFRVIGPGIVAVGENAYLLDTSNVPFGWKTLPFGNTYTLPPVPVSSLVDYYAGQVAITDSGEGWGKVGGVWTDLGPIPGGSMPTRQESWGQLKAKYAR